MSVRCHGCVRQLVLQPVPFPPVVLSRAPKVNVNIRRSYPSSPFHSPSKYATMQAPSSSSSSASSASSSSTKSASRFTFTVPNCTRDDREQVRALEQLPDVNCLFAAKEGDGVVGYVSFKSGSKYFTWLSGHLPNTATFGPAHNDRKSQFRRILLKEDGHRKHQSAIVAEYETKRARRKNGQGTTPTAQQNPSAVGSQSELESRTQVEEYYKVIEENGKLRAQMLTMEKQELQNQNQQLQNENQQLQNENQQLQNENQQL